MARFYGTLSNSKGGTTTAMGEHAGQTGHVFGQHLGVKVESRRDYADQKADAFEVYATNGNEGRTGHKVEILLGVVTYGADGVHFTPAEAQS